MDADLNERNESMVLYRIIKMHSSDREDGCPINSGIVSIYYPSISSWELFIYDCIDIYKYCEYRINDTTKINTYM